MRINFDALAHDAVAEHDAQQKSWELARFGELLLEHGYTSIIEVGTYAGGTAWFLHQLGLELTVVDRSLVGPHRIDGVRYMQGDSVAVAARLDPVDAVFIDADHAYEGVKRDWLAYRPLVVPFGCVAFHDIVDHFSPEHDLNCHVDQLWAELKPGHRTMELFDPDNTNAWGGIGVVWP